MNALTRGLFFVLIALGAAVWFKGAEWFGAKLPADPVAPVTVETPGDDSFSAALRPGEASPRNGGEDPDPGLLQAEESPDLAEAYAMNTAAVKALDEEAFDEAIDLFKRATEVEPSNETFLGNLGEAYLRRARAVESADVHAAIADYEEALVYVGSDARKDQIRTLRDRARAIADEEADFSDESTLHFTFRFDRSRTELRAGVDRLQELLEETYQEYGDLFGRRPVEAGEPKIQVVFYGSEGFNNVTGLGDWAGGVFDGTIRVPADDLRSSQRVARLRDVLRHEVAHAFIRSIGGKRVPAWLNEGISQWLESPERRAGSLGVARARLAKARDQGGKPLFPLGELTGALSSWSDRDEITRAYDQALAFTDYLASQYGSRVLFDMVASCKERGVDGAGEEFQRQILLGLDVVLGDFNGAL